MVDGAGSTGRQAHGNAVKRRGLGGLGGRGFALGDVGHSLGSFGSYKGHHLRFEAQQVGGMFKTRPKPCGQPYGLAHPARNYGGNDAGAPVPKIWA